jgi:serine/threonine-protein kinase
MLQSMFGPYRIEELLGRGGMGEVYRAYDTKTDRMVALKLLPAHLAEDDEYQARFRRECRVAARLSEPHVVPIHQFGEIDGRLYLDMRLVEGTDLSAWLRTHGPMPPDVAVAVVGQVAQALDAAHSDGLVHRDIKPSNVLLAGASGRELDVASVFAYLFDFGIARARDGALAPDEVALTSSGVVPGSPSYVAPERFRGVEGDPRADVYALACVLHQALVGRPPFEGDLLALMRAHLQTPPPKASEMRAGVPAGLDDVVARGMAKDPDDRYATAGALALEARAVLVTGSGITVAIDPGRTVVRGDRAAAGHGPTASATGTTQATGGPSATATPVTTPRPRPTEQRTASPQPVTSRLGTTPVARPQGAQLGAGGPRPVHHTTVPPGGRPTYPPPQPPVPPPAHPSLPSVVPPAAPRRSAVPLLLTALVLAAVVAVGGVMLASDLGAGTTSGTGGATPSTTPPPPATEDDKLLAGLPAGFSAQNCTPDTVSRDKVGASAYVNCNSGPSDGPGTASFARFATKDGLQKAFLRAAGDARIVAAPGQRIDICRQGRTNLGPWVVGRQADVVRGQMACIVAADRAAYLLWSDDATRSFGYVTRADGNAAVLYDWWRKADFRLL